MTNKPVYLPRDNKNTGLMLAIAFFLGCTVGLLCTVAADYYYRGMPATKEITISSDQPESCKLMAIAFDEAQMAPGWYESTGKELIKCGYKKDLINEMVHDKYCAAMRWNGYEAKDCPDDEKN